MYRNLQSKLLLHLEKKKKKIKEKKAPLMSILEFVSDSYLFCALRVYICSVMESRTTTSYVYDYLLIV